MMYMIVHLQKQFSNRMSLALANVIGMRSCFCWRIGAVSDTALLAQERRLRLFRGLHALCYSRFEINYVAFANGRSLNF